MHSITEFLSRFLSPDQGAMSAGHLLGAIAIAYAGGILASLTPCVYPMIPITVSVIGGIGGGTGQARRSWHEIWIRGGCYVGGMAVVYSFLGVLAGLTGRVFGTFTNSSGWYLGLGVVMTFAALMMIDVIPFDPLMMWESFKRRMGIKRAAAGHNAHEKQMTHLGAFTLGASSGLIAAPCTTPVLTSILAYIARTQSIGVGLSLMLSFSLGLGTLLLVIAIFTGALQVLPKSGNWMKTVKTASGLLLLAFAEYLIFRAGAIGGF